MNMNDLWEKGIKLGATIVGGIAGILGEGNILLTVLAIAM